LQVVVAVEAVAVVVPQHILTAQKVRMYKAPEEVVEVVAEEDLTGVQGPVAVPVL
jgi:hypothetical protein